MIPYSPTRGLRVLLAGAWRRYQCGRRFGHFPTDSEYPSCLRCNAPLM